MGWLVPQHRMAAVSKADWAGVLKVVFIRYLSFRSLVVLSGPDGVAK